MVATPQSVKYLPHARPRRTVRLDGLWIGLFLVLVSAAVTVAVLWFALSVLLSFGTYLETVLP